MRLWFSFFAPLALWAAPPAFPGAEGAGANATGGRGGDVYRVINLNDSGPGSLREGIRTATGPRTIVFDVAGTIMLRSALSINRPDLTLAGQTAPGDGITIAGWTVAVSNTRNVIVRYLRFRPGDSECPRMQGDAFTIDKSQDVIADHVSASWSVDETLSVTESDRVTVQWSAIAESLNTACHEKGDHGYGSLLRYGSGVVTFHHNLFAHHRSRNPRVGDNIGLDFVNNTIYNAGGEVGYSGAADEGSPRINYTGNYIVAGPSTSSSRRTRAFSGGSANTRIFQSGNRIDSNVNRVRDGADTGWAMFVGTYTRADARFDFPQVRAEEAPAAYARVLAEAGHSLARDAVDARVFADAANDTGGIIGSQTDVGGHPELRSAPPAPDADGDGVPDVWERARGLDARDPADGAALTPSGYSNLEIYLDELTRRKRTTAGISIVDDALADGDSQNQDLAAGSLRLFNGRTGTARADAAGAVAFDLTNAGGSDAWWAFFTGAGSPVTLDPGDRLTVAIGFTLSGLQPNAGGIRFGVLDSLGTRNANNLTVGMNDATFVNDPGYGVEFFPAGSGSPFVLGRRAVLSGGNVFNNFGDFAAIAGAGATTRQPLANGTPYTLTYTIERLSETQTRVTATVTGGELAGLSYTGVETSPDPVRAFDYFAFRVAGPTFSTGVAFSRFRVEFAPAEPLITTHPQPPRLTVRTGSAVTLSAAASGGRLVWEWRRNGIAIDRAASPTLALANLRPSDSGEYVAVASNAGGSASSDPVSLAVTDAAVPPAPVILTQPSPVSVRRGAPATLSVRASGDNLVYQWFRNGALVAGAGGSELRIEAAGLIHAGVYTVVVANSSGTAASAPAALTVLSPMLLTGAVPDHNTTGICLDATPSLWFDRPVRLGAGGRVRLHRDDGTVVETIDAAARTQSRLIGGLAFNYYPLIAEGTSLTIYPRQPLDRARTYHVSVEPGVVVDEEGAPFEGVVEHAWRFTARATAPEALVVGGDGGYCTVQGAIDAVPANNTAPAVVSLRPGTYTGLVYVPSNKPFITVEGEDAETTVIRYPNNNNLNPSVARALFGVDAADFNLRGVTVHNTTPRGGSQAEAFRGNNRRILLDRVALKSFQDTLWLQGSGFVARSYIEGDVDFLWGGGAVMIRDSELKAVTSGSVYTQIRNGAGQNGYVFVNCRFTAAPGVANVYLSRIDPTVFPFSQVVLIDNELGPHILPVAWQLNNASAAPTIQFWEYGSRNPDGSPASVAARHPSSRQITAQDAARWSDPAFVLDGWNPALRN